MKKSEQTHSNLSHGDVKIINREVVYKGYFSMVKYHLKHRLFCGEWSDVFERELFERGDSVGVLLFDPSLNSIVLIEQFRLGALDDEKSPWLLEIVAGVVDEEDEDTAQVAIRETKEEANLDILKIEPITKYWVSPGGASESMTLYCGKVDAEHAGGVHGLDSENEDIRVLVMPIAEVWQALDQNIIRNGPSIIALQWLRIHYDALVAKWRV